MAPQLLKDLATHSRKWIIQCRVARKWIATNCNTGKVLHMDMVLLDSKGSDIWAMVPPLLISKFESSLKEQEVYEIRHFKVALTKNSFRPVPNRLMIEFDSATLVQHVQSVPKIPLHKFYFLKQADMMQKLYDKKNLSVHFVVLKIITSNGETTLTAPVLIAEVPPVEIPKISIAQLNDFKTMEEHTVLNMTLKLHVRLTQFNFSNPQAEYSVASVDHDPLQQVTKIPDPVSVGGSTSCGLKRKHDDDADPVEE
ncbi:unnamed protein product [Linum tenue]|uniref:Replication protein A 70 kDa DNA-binding subunit B/D first OB fold domain-containing protein n=1 Tax=Linum tenue TaxID=586396 RepID=A0AAV0KV77_9ROSI|nr:unnamed protein product [Linum tenue]